MELVRRNDIPVHLKTLCPKPTQERGCFFALKGHHDLGFTDTSADLNFLLRQGRVWMGKAGTKPDWIEIFSTSDLPKFDTEYVDNWEPSLAGWQTAPFMPQFFFAPRTMRGFKTLRRVMS